MTIASAGQRLLGRLLDGIVAAGLAVIALVSTGGHASSVHERLVFAALLGLYEVVAIAGFGRTIGKAMARTRVVDEETGARPDTRQALLRWAVPAGFGVATTGIAGDVGTVALLGFAYQVVVYEGVLRDPRRRGLHDKAAATVVLSDTVTVPAAPTP